MQGTALPRGCEIHHYPGRNQPYTVYIRGSGETYNPATQQFIWQFCHTLNDALRFIEGVTGERLNGVAR